MAAPMERMILQSDWQYSLREEKGRAWITYKGTNCPSVHGHLDTQGMSREGVPEVTGTDGFSVQNITKYTLTARYSGELGSLTRKFVAPQISFSAIHKQNKSVPCIDVTAGGLGVSCDSENKLLVWQTSDGEVRRRLEGHMGDVYTCQFFPSGVVLLSGGADMQMKIWSVETGKCAATLRGHTAGILETAVVDRGRNIVSCGRDGTAKLWDVGQSSVLTTFKDCGGIVNSCAVEVTENSIDLGAPDNPPSEREVSTEGRMLLLGCENATLQGYGLRSRQKIFELDCHSAVNVVTFLSDVQAVCGTQDGHLTVVDIRNVRVPVKEWQESRSAILSLLPHKQGFFASTGDGSCFFVDERQETRVELTGADCDPVYGTACDGSHVYTSCRDGAIRRYSLLHV
ncbi:proteasomal ATPase-associated factor 1-like [Haliotis cracherodii]|uniref:proteasomal ATPase-associated factor 1-like n=1 Tax=Haliotis cracherodii TaxID=6455 RepID=UPI0039EB528E